MITTGNKNFWKAQLIGWGTAMFTNFIVQYYAGFPTDLLIYNSVIPLVICFLITTGYRYLIKESEWKNWNFGKILLMIIGSTILMTVIFLLFASFIFAVLLDEGGIGLSGLLGNSMIFAILFLNWNMIYFCIQFFNSWNKAEVEKWKLAAEIKDAQLGSLKSQINPHFIFNTINNIRSLILEDKEKAREMLLNFSDLFRYALKNTDQSTVTLKDKISD